MARFFQLAASIALLCVLFLSVDSKVSTEKVFSLTTLSRQELDFLPPWKVASIRALQTRLIKYNSLRDSANANAACLSVRDAKINGAIARLEAARRCRYNGLPFAIYDRLRPVCQQRSSASREVFQARRTCEALPFPRARYTCRLANVTPCTNFLTEINAVCDRLGITSLAPRACPAILPLRQAVTLLRSEDCGTGLFTGQEIIDMINALVSRIRELLGGVPLPSNDPRFFDVPLN